MKIRTKKWISKKSKASTSSSASSSTTTADDPLSHVEIVDTEYNLQPTKSQSELNWAPIHCGIERQVPLSRLEPILKTYGNFFHTQFITTNDGWTPLSLALVCGASPEVITRILELFPDLVKITTQDDESTPLHLALANHIAPEIVLAIRTLYPGATKIKNKHGWTPYEVGIMSNAPLLSLQAIQLFDPFHTKHFGLFSTWSPLRLALLTNNTPEVLSSPLFTGDINFKYLRDEEGSAPLAIHLQNPRATNQTVTALIKAHPEGCSMKNKYGYSPLAIAIRSKVSIEIVVAIYGSYPNAIKLLTIDGHSCLSLCLLHQAQPDVFLFLLERDISVIKHTNQHEQTLLHLAMQYCAESDIVAFLLKKFPAAAKMRDNNGNLPLHTAMRYDSPVKSIHILRQAYKEAGTIKNRQGELPIHTGMRYNASAESIEEVLLANFPELGPQLISGSDSDPLFVGLKHNASAKSIAVLLHMYPDLKKVESSYGKNPIHIAMQYGSTAKIIKLLLKDYPEAAKLRTSDGYGPLDLAMKHNASVDVIQAFLDVYPDAAKTNRPLKIGIQVGASVDVIRLLLSSHQEVKKIKSQDGWTLLHMALKYGSPVEIIKLLIEHHPEAVVAETKHRRWTPLCVALVHNSKVEAVAALINAFRQDDKRGDHIWKGACVGMEHDARPDSIQHLLTVSHRLARRKDHTKQWTLLHIGAAHKASPELIKVVLAVNRKSSYRQDKNGDTPLHLAMKNNLSTEAIKLILEANPAAAKTRNNEGLTAFQIGIKCEVDLQSIVIVMEEWPQAAQIRDKDGATPLLDMISLQVSDETTTSSKAKSEAERPDVHEYTSVIKQVFDAYPAAAGDASARGSSPVSILVSKCAASKSLDEALNGDTLIRLRFLMKGLRDGRVLLPLFRLDSPVSSQIFFSLFVNESSNGLITDTTSEVPILDLNQEAIPGWTILEIMADFDTEDSSMALLQIVKEQSRLLALSGENNLIVISTADTEGFIGFDSICAVTESTMQKVADRAKLSHASKELREWGQGYGRFLRKYRIDKDKNPKHISETCVVVFATQIIEGEDGRLKEKRVALKFMSQHDAFLREMMMRKSLDLNLVVPIIAAYSSIQSETINNNEQKDDDNYENNNNVVDSLQDLNHEFVDLEKELFPYKKIRLKQTNKSTKKSLQYLLVMESGAGVDLNDFISHQNIAGNDLPVVVTIAKQICHCLQVLNEQCGVLHGDVKARNFVAKGIGLSFSAIDLDNSASIVNGDPASRKRTSSGYLPPEQALIEAMSRGIDSKKVDQPSESQPPQPFVVATPQYDMWCFGVLLYYLCTGRNLFNLDTRENIGNKELQILCDWSVETRNEKLDDIPRGWPKSLVESLLQKEPSSRPSKWDDVISELDKLGKVGPWSDNLVDRVVMFQSGPIRYVDRLQFLPLLNFDLELEMLKETLKDAADIGATIDVDVEIAMPDRFSAFLANPSSVMHLSCHGDPECLAFEDGFGGVKPLQVQQLKEFLGPSCAEKIKLVFVSACHSRFAGEAFVHAGIRHVVCCHQDHKLSDRGAVEFARHFYRNLAFNMNLQDAFNKAKQDLSIINSTESQKYILLPEKPNDPDYHNVPIFYQDANIPRKIDDPNVHLSFSCLPRIPPDFIGAERNMWEILQLLQVRKVDVIRVDGGPGVGKTSIVAAACRYVIPRKQAFLIDRICWIPPPEDVVVTVHNNDDILYEALYSMIRELMQKSNNDDDDKTQEKIDWSNHPIMTKLVHYLSKTRIILVLDGRQFSSTETLLLSQRLEDFIAQLLGSVAKIKIILIKPQRQNGIHCRREETVMMRNLDLFHSAQLFGCYTPFCYASEFVKRIMPPAIIMEKIKIDPQCKESKRYFKLYKRLGRGVPRDIITLAKGTTQNDIESYLNWWDFSNVIIQHGNNNINKNK